MRRSSSRAMRTRIVCSARARRRATRGRPAAVEQRAARQPELGPEIVQMPLQRVVERDALADQALAMIDEQPQIELGTRPAAPPARHPGLRASAARARPRSASMLSDLPRPRARAARLGHQLASPRARRARRARSETARTSPRHAGSPRAPTPARRRAPRAQRTSAAKPLAPTWTVCSPSNSPVAATTAAIVCERLWVSAPSTIIDPRPPPSSNWSGRPADTACWGRCHAPYLCRAPASSAGSGIDGLDRWAAAVRARGWWCGSCARGRPALSRSAVSPCGGAGDMMVDGVIPLGEALRPLGLSGPSTLAWRQERAGSRPRRIG